MINARILLVEDDPISATRAMKMLEEIQAQVTHVTTGEAAVALFEAPHEFHLILMDLYLPKMNGFQATESIRGSDSYRENRIPIIALTSNALMEPKEQFLKKTGFSDYLTKPARQHFVAQVKKHLPRVDAKLSWY
jgi:CheY-like chemotaxis protein